MSDNIKESAPSREEIDAMSTQELMELIRQDAELPANSSSDEELIFYILEVLAKREEMRDVVLHKNPEEAHEKFQKLYLNTTEQGIPIDNTPRAKRIKEKQVVRFPRWLRSVSVIAASLALVLIAGSITIKAMGIDPWERFATWTKELFFYSSSQTELPVLPEPDVADWEKMLEKHVVSVPAVPHWLPDGYELTDVYEQVSPFAASLTAEFTNQKDVLILNLRIYTNAAGTAFDEKDETDVEIYEVGGNIYHIYLNEGNTTASCELNDTDISIYGPISVDEMKQIIASFYERK